MNSSAVKRTLVASTLLLAITVGIVSCSTSSRPFAVARSKKARVKASDVDQGDLKQLVGGNTQFACSLYHQLRDRDDNVLLSPYSISLALAMTYAGARGETEQQMAEALCFTLPQRRLHVAFNALDLELADRGDDAGGFRFDMVNSLWTQEDYEFLSAFLNILAKNYGAGLNLLDFENEPELSRKIINDWISDQTEGKIQEIIPAGYIHDLTRLVLTNAIYFKAAWKYPFHESYTRDRTFSLLDGSQVSVPMMHLGSSTVYDRGGRREGARVNYAHGEGYEALELLYEGDELSIVFLLPEAGSYREFEDRLDGNTVVKILDSLQDAEVGDVAVPKFSHTSESISLTKTLSEMGMPIAFIYRSADFSGMDGTRELFIDDILHKTFIAVDEAGTEAAASTSVLITAGLSFNAVHIVLDRPFIYMIRDVETNTILFLGRVLDPTA